MRSLATFACSLAYAALLASCQLSDVDDPSFDLWCGKELCYWQRDEGQVARVGTWNRSDTAVSLLTNPTQISQLQETSLAGCVTFDLIADVEVSAHVLLRLDYGDDGIVDFEQLIPQARWSKLSFEVPTPSDYERVRYVLRKQGEGRAVLAHLRVTHDSRCGAAALALPDGSSCRLHTACASGLCSDGKCVRCPAQGCGEGVVCSSNAQCEAGACVTGRCRACAAQGACPALSGCEKDEQCASARCMLSPAASQLTDLKFPSVCAECAHDGDCQGGVCVKGTCASCLGDADCPPELVCRYRDEYDATERTCLPALESPRTRGALCERPEDCADDLRCTGTDRLPARCGGACEVDRDCRSEEREGCFSNYYLPLLDLLDASVRSDLGEAPQGALTCVSAEALGLGMVKRAP